MEQLWKIRCTIALITVGLVALAEGQVKTFDECFIVSQVEFLQMAGGSLAPCAVRAGPLCCSAVASLIGVGIGSPVEGCLCDAAFLQVVLLEVDESPAAAALGVDSNFVLNILQSCNADHGSWGNCPGAGPGYSDEPETVVEDFTGGSPIGRGRLRDFVLSG